MSIIKLLMINELVRSQSRSKLHQASKRFNAMEVSDNSLSLLDFPFKKAEKIEYRN